MKIITMMHHIKRSEFSMKNNWLTSLRESQKGLEQMPSNSVSDLGFAGISSLAAERLLISELSKRAMMKSAYGRECSVDFSHMTRMGNFPDPPAKEKLEENFPIQPVVEDSVTAVSPNGSMKLRALSRVSDITPLEKLPANIIYLVELGMEIEAIRKVVRGFSPFAYYTLDGKIKPLVEFLLDLGIQKQHIPTILSKRPQLCGISLTENLIPTMIFLEELGVDKKQWAKLICRCPHLLTCSRQKMKTGVKFLYEMGLSAENVGKVLTRFPNILLCSVEENLHPTAEYFRSLEVDVGVLLYKSPQIFTLSIEANLKPKWEFFLTMVYPKSELLKFPPYFGYSLEDRIKPRYEIVRKSGVKVGLSQMMSPSDLDFQELLQKKMKKKLSHVHVSVA